jgi:hypothetical protein
MSKSDEDDGEPCDSGDEIDVIRRDPARDSEASTSNA